MGDYDFDPRKIGDEQLYDIIKFDAQKLGIAPYPASDLLAKVRYMTRHRKYFADMSEKYLRNVDRVRIVPIKTKELDERLAGYIIGLNSEKKASVLKLVNLRRYLVKMNLYLVETRIN